MGKRWETKIGDRKRPGGREKKKYPDATVCLRSLGYIERGGKLRFCIK